MTEASLCLRNVLCCSAAQVGQTSLLEHCFFRCTWVKPTLLFSVFLVTAVSSCYFLAHCPLQVQYPFSAASPKACSLLVWSASVLTLYGLLCVYLLAVFSKLQLHHRNSCNYLLVSYVIVWRAGMYNFVGEDFIAELIWIAFTYLYKLAATRCN